MWWSVGQHGQFKWGTNETFDCSIYAHYHCHGTQYFTTTKDHYDDDNSKNKVS